jgi:hypothetical protein
VLLGFVVSLAAARRLSGESMDGTTAEVHRQAQVEVALGFRESAALKSLSPGIKVVLRPQASARDSCCQDGKCQYQCGQTRMLPR